MLVHNRLGVFIGFGCSGSTKRTPKTFSSNCVWGLGVSRDDKTIIEEASSGASIRYRISCNSNIKSTKIISFDDSKEFTGLDRTRHQPSKNERLCCWLDYRQNEMCD